MSVKQKSTKSDNNNTNQFYTNQKSKIEEQRTGQCLWESTGNQWDWVEYSCFLGHLGIHRTLTTHVYFCHINMIYNCSISNARMRNSIDTSIYVVKRASMPLDNRRTYRIDCCSPLVLSKKCPYYWKKDFYGHVLYCVEKGYRSDRAPV